MRYLDLISNVEARIASVPGITPEVLSQVKEDLESLRAALEDLEAQVYEPWEEIPID